MDEENKEITKKVFISYSWTSKAHEKWVLELASRLVDSANIDVILDKWDLKQGQDKYVFMEKMVQDETIDKVLIVCDKGYKEKANKREGGVGTEAQIITPALYGKASETKFIPIIAEEGEIEFDEYMPNYIKSRIGIIMSSPESYIQGYEELVRVIYDEPRYIKPKLSGKKPNFLNENIKKTSKLYFINKSLSKYIEEDRQGMIENTISEFKDTFFNELDAFSINNDDFKEPYNEQLIDNINAMKLIRDEYITFLENLVCGYTNFDSDIIIEIFEKLYSYTEYQGTGSSYKSCITEHYKFLITELFIWTNIILLKYKKYETIKDILYTRYSMESKFGNKNKQHFVNFRYWLDYIESSQNSNSKRLSIMADKLIERADYKNKNYKNEIIDTDILLSYISKVNGDSNAYEYWFPVTYIYRNEYSKMKIIEKMERRKYFEEIKILFNVDNKEEMKQLIEEKLSKVERGYINSFSHIPIIPDSIDINDIGKY